MALKDDIKEINEMLDLIEEESSESVFPINGAPSKPFLKGIHDKEYTEYRENIVKMETETAGLTIKDWGFRSGVRDGVNADFVRIDDPDICEPDWHLYKEGFEAGLKHCLIQVEETFDMLHTDWECRKVVKTYVVER